MRLSRRFGIVLMLLLVASPAVGLAVDHPLRGVALVIGESRYANLTKLDNPKDDARAMDDLLDDLGFDVDRVLDADGDELRAGLADFIDKAKDADVALVYYSGHGIEAGGDNYLVPVNADISTPKAAGASLVPVKDLLDALAKTVPVTILLLDACRTDAFPPGQLIQLPGTDVPLPVAETGLGEERGPTPLSRPDVPADNLGMVIGFAASPGQPALDGAPGEDNSPYAAALLKHLAAGGYSFGDVMTMVSEEVYLKTKARQLPWVNSSLRRVLSFGKPVEQTDGDEASIRQGRRQLLLTVASAPDTTRQYVEAIANTEGVPLDALYGMLKVLGVDTSAGQADLEQQLLEGAKQLKTFMEQKPGGVKSDPDLVRLASLADQAQTEGAMDLALKFREQATERARAISGERDKLEADLASDRLEIGATFAEHAQTATLNFDFGTAAKMFGEAYAQVARWDDDKALEYKRNEADALRAYGEYQGDNDALLQALVSYQEALQLAPRETRLGDWVAIENNLGWALLTLGGRESDTAHLEQAVTVLQAALDGYPKDSSPLDWSVTKMNLGNVLTELGQREGDSSRLEQGLVAFEEALAASPRAEDPIQWGKVQLNLASVLRIIGERESDPDKLERSVTAFQAALEELRREIAPLDWAFAQNNYGTALFALGVMRHDRAMLEQAATAFENALLERTPERAPLDRAMSLSNLGNVRATIAQQTGDVGAMRQSIAAYREGLHQITREKVPLLWATAQSNLGVVLTSLGEATDDNAALEEAVAALRLALEERTRAVDPINWAMTQFNLAGALQDLGRRGLGDEYFTQAIEATEAALTEWTRERAPFNWARAHFNLGLVLAGVADRETGTQSLVRAVTSYRQALEVFSAAETPVEWGTTEEHLGMALQSMGDREDGPESYRAAVEAYRLALTSVDKASDPAGWYRMQFNVALTLQNLAGRGEAGALEQAEAAYRRALETVTKETAPADWADAHYNLGVVLHTIASSGEGVDILNDAIANYRQALEVRLRADDPLLWARITNYLGNALGLLAQRTDDKAAAQEGRDAVAGAWDAFRAVDNSYDDDFRQRIAAFDDLLAKL